MARAQSVSVDLDAKVAEKLSGTADHGRLVVYMIAPGAKVRGGWTGAEPTDGFFEEDPQPMFGIDAAEIKPGTPLEIGPDVKGMLGRGGGNGAWGAMSDLKPGKYQVQAVWIRNRENAWKECGGNLYSEVVTGELAKGKTLNVKLTKATKDRVWPTGPDVYADEFVIKSKLLSDFAGHEVLMRAGVRWPMKDGKRNVEPGRKYAAQYEVPGFGGDHYAALRMSRRPAGRELREESFYIVLDPSSPTGHVLFCDSDNNGPWGKALTEELIPALEARYPLASRPEARLLRGHSSGGWSTLWLATEYPNVFGACWSSSPDPVDFRRFELVDIYSWENQYSVKGVDTSSARMGGGESTMTVRQENLMEYVLGPGMRAGQQWTSWQACWGTRGTDGWITPLYDIMTGVIDRKEAETYRRFDIAERLRKDPARFVPLFRKNIRLLVGTKDDYYLNEAVRLLADDLQRLDPTGKLDGDGGQQGYIKFVDGATHQTIFQRPAIGVIPAEMITHLRAAGLMRPGAPTTRP